jgi:hypothetical protein
MKKMKKLSSDTPDAPETPEPPAVASDASVGPLFLLVAADFCLRCFFILFLPGE